MTKEGKKNNINLIPVLLLVAVIAVAGYLLLKDTINLPWTKKGDSIEVTRIEGFPKTIETEKDLKKQRLIIKSKEELKGFLDYLDIKDENFYESVLSQVNFDQRYLIGVSSDLQEETEGMYRIKRVLNDKQDASLKVVVIQYKPDITCAPQIKNNVLADLVIISKTDLAVSFDVVKETKRCD